MSDGALTHDAHVLYHFDYSICSIMVRYAIALCGESKEQHVITIREQKVDILHGEHFTEDFLCNLNPRGEVPVLAKPDGQSIPDSVEITKYLTKFYPSLIPASHDNEIKDLLSKIHAISFFSITFAGRPEGQQSNKRHLEELLSGELNEEYRKAIAGRIEIIDQHLNQLDPQEAQENEEYARSLLRELDELLSASRSGWLLGLEKPSALDAHLISFIARLLDRKREDLVPERLQQYALRAESERAWNDVMQGRSTLPLKI